jgi:hypothetical protein
VSVIVSRVPDTSPSLVSFHPLLLLSVYSSQLQLIPVPQQVLRKELRYSPDRCHTPKYRSPLSPSVEYDYNCFQYGRPHKAYLSVMSGLEDAIRVIAERTPHLTPQELTWLSESLKDVNKRVKRRQLEINSNPRPPGQRGPQAVLQHLDNHFPAIEDMITKGFPLSGRVANILAHDVADAHRTPMTQARGALANLCIASAHDQCDEIGKAEKKIRKTRLETLPADAGFRGTMKYFIEFNGLDHIAHIAHGLSKVGYKLLYLLRCPESNCDLLGLLLFGVGPLSHVKNGQLGELRKLIEKYRGFAEENRGWFRRWLASYRGIVLEQCFSNS